MSDIPVVYGQPLSDMERIDIDDDDVTCSPCVTHEE